MKVSELEAGVICDSLTAMAQDWHSLIELWGYISPEDGCFSVHLDQVKAAESEERSVWNVKMMCGFPQGFEDDPEYPYMMYREIPKYSTTDKAQAFELIEKFNVDLLSPPHDAVLGQWVAWALKSNRDGYTDEQTDVTPALAICKAVISSKWGDTIPDEIMKQVEGL